MSEQTQTAQGGFVQGITLPVVGGCCGTAGASPTTSCCSEPVMASAPPAGVQAARLEDSTSRATTTDQLRGKEKGQFDSPGISRRERIAHARFSASHL
jgi:hypothetical protein